MAIVQRELVVRCSHFEIGDYIEYGWFRGEIVGINYPSLQQLVRVHEVIRAAPGRTVGAVTRVSFNLGQLSSRPERRNNNECE
jgi:hypothetical protein